MQNTFNVQGMTCGHCERTVTNAVKQLDADAKVQIDRAQGKVVVDSVQPANSIAAAIAAIVGAIAVALKKFWDWISGTSSYSSAGGSGGGPRPTAADRRREHPRL